MNKRSCDSEKKTTADMLYYDGACPLCSREIAQLRKTRGDDICLIDIHQPNAAVDEDVPSQEQLLRNLHMKTANGEWLVGIDANIYAWRNTSIAWCWNLLRLPLIYPTAKRVYAFWAKRRYQKRYSS